MNHTKKCTVCQVEKDTSCFAFKNKDLGKLQSRCKECQAVYHRKHYLNNTDYYKNKRRVNNRKYRSAGKKFINDYKANSGCYFCEENTPCCLDFHHLDPSQKDSNVANMKGHARSIHLIQSEIKKCIVVCSNCHRKIHAGIIKVGLEGIAPSSRD